MMNRNEDAERGRAAVRNNDEQREMFYVNIAADYRCSMNEMMIFLPPSSSHTVVVYLTPPGQLLIYIYMLRIRRLNLINCKP